MSILLPAICIVSFATAVGCMVGSLLTVFTNKLTSDTLSIMSFVLLGFGWVVLFIANSV